MFSSLNESPSEKEGKLQTVSLLVRWFLALNESPSEKEGKSQGLNFTLATGGPSMKVPPKRKGN